jgi:flagellar biosynthesis/type III secretory pathway chaperone
LLVTRIDGQRKALKKNAIMYQNERHFNFFLLIMVEDQKKSAYQMKGKTK